MGWRCFLLKEQPYRGSPEYRPGAMWFAERQEDYEEYLFVPHKEFLVSNRNPLWVLLPAQGDYCEWFCMDQKATDGDSGWSYTGVPPNITLSPSINCIHRYHGFIQNGIITPCIEGRKFPNWPEDV